MIDIEKLAKLTWLQLTADENLKFSTQLESVVTLLEKVKHYDIPDSTTSWHELLWLETIPKKTGVSDGDPDRIIANVDHPIVGHAVEVKGFVE